MVWQKEFGCPLKVKNDEAISHQYTTDDITAIIGISGKVEGNVLYGFSQGLVKEIIKQMVGEEFDAKDPMSLSALS
jgi:CheY-specific phosphatase CheX